jgi:hypothetical protein
MKPNNLVLEFANSPALQWFLDSTTDELGSFWSEFQNRRAVLSVCGFYNFQRAAFLVEEFHNQLGYPLD